MTCALNLLAAAAVALAAPAVAAAPAQKPTIVLVHGAFADALGWQKVIPILLRDGYSVTAVENPLESLDGDIATTKRVIDAQTRPVVLVGHSYGGAVITGAAAGEPNVKALVYLAAFAPEAGEAVGAFGDKYPADLSKALRPDSAGFLTVDRAQFRADFAADVPAGDVAVAAATQKPLSSSVFAASVPGRGVEDDPGMVCRFEARPRDQPRPRALLRQANARPHDRGRREPRRLHFAPEGDREGDRGGGREREVTHDLLRPSRRELCAGAAAVAVAARMGSLGMPASAQGFAPLRQVDAGLLRVSYAEAGPADGPPVLLLHGWPYDVHAFDEVAALLAAKGFRAIAPYLRGYGPTRFLSADEVRNGQPAALAMDAVDLLDALKIKRALLAGFDWGGRTADIVAALWPDRVAGLVAVSGYQIGSQAAGQQPLPPAAEYQWWYQYYFATERGRLGYEKNRHDFNKLIWKLASPQWHFDDATFERSAAAFDNPDHVAIVIHNYRWRLGLAEGEPQYDAIEQKLADAPPISVPTITMEGDANGAPHPPPEAYPAKFTGKYEHRTISGGIGHNLPQEAPVAFAQAVIDIAKG